MKNNVHRCLFIDDFHLTELKGLKRTMHSTEKHPANPVIRPDRLWEGKAIRASNSTLYDRGEGLFKIWYYAGERACYAVSRNGLDWDKPALGLLEYEGSERNNLVLGGPGHIIYGGDDFGHMTPDQTYRSIGWTAEKGQHVLMSSDGLRWTGGEGLVLPGAGDTFVVGKSTDSLTGLDDAPPGYPHPDNLPRYIGVVRLCCPVGRFDGSSDIRPTRRVQALTTSDDLKTWSFPTRVLTPDAIDDDMAHPRIEAALADGSLEHDCVEDRRCELYTMLIVPYEDMYIGMLQVFDAAYEFHRVNKNNQSGPMEIQLVASRDLLDWQRLGDRAAFISRGGTGEFDWAAVCYPSLPIVNEGRLWIYYTGTISTHAGSRDADYFNRLLARVESGQVPGTHGIGLATLRRDGFVSLDAEEEPGWVITKPFAWPQSGRLHVNADARGGEVCVTVCQPDRTPVPGYELSQPLTGDLPDGLVLWEGKEVDKAGPAYTHGTTEEAPVMGGAAGTGLKQGEKVRLKISARNARLYSYWFD